MQCVTAVDGHWLAELGPMFFSVKESVRTRLVCEHDCSPNEISRLVCMEQLQGYASLNTSLPLNMHTHTLQEKKLAAKDSETFSDGG